jgi:hypothetical protein
MYRNVVVIAALLSVACTSETIHPLQTFVVKVPPPDMEHARQLIYQQAVTHKMQYWDHTRTFPSGTFVLNAGMSNENGLQLLFGNTSENNIHVGIYCKEECPNWKLVADAMRAQMASRWEVIN